MIGRHMVSAVLKGLVLTPLGGVVGAIIGPIAADPLGGPGTFFVDPEYWTLAVPYGALFALPATIVMFPTLYAIWPGRTRSSFVCVMIFSALGGFVSPLLIMRPQSIVLDRGDFMLGVIGMVSAVILAPLYYYWTRNRRAAAA